MPSGSFKQADVLCPFYKYDDGKRCITCEGLVGDKDDSSLALIYHSKRDYEAQIDVFCCEHYLKCEIYRMLMAAKYEEE
jgi:hypothetical protein